MKLLLKWLIMTISIVLAGMITHALGFKFITNYEQGGSLGQIFIGAAVLALVNATLGRILKLLTIPLNCLTLGLFSLVINAGMLLLVASLNLGFRIEGTLVDKFLAALVGSILISAVNGVLGSLIPDKRDDD